ALSGAKQAPAGPVPATLRQRRILSSSQAAIGRDGGPMLDSNQPDPTLPAQRPAVFPPPSALEKVNAAKWPPDDDDDVPAAPPAGGGGGVPSGGGYDGGDGNFKRGRFKPIAVIVGLLRV